MVWFCVEATLLENVTNRFPVTRCWMVMFAPGGPWLVPPANTGLMDSCEIPATLETRLVTWLLTCDATKDSAAWLAGVVFCALASVVEPKASRLMISAAGNAGSDE